MTKEMIFKFSLKEWQNLPERKWNEIKTYNDIFIVPTGSKHVSGWSMMHIVGKNKDEMEIASTCDDLAWITTLRAKDGMVRTDMIYPLGILHYWSNEFSFQIGEALSSTELKVIKKQFTK